MKRLKGLIFQSVDNSAAILVVVGVGEIISIAIWIGVRNLDPFRHSNSILLSILSIDVNPPPLPISCPPLAFFFPIHSQALFLRAPSWCFVDPPVHPAYRCSYHPDQIAVSPSIRRPRGARPSKAIFLAFFAPLRDSFPSVSRFSSPLCALCVSARFLSLSQPLLSPRR